MKVSIGTVAKELGVTVETIRAWEEKGKIKSERTLGEHRRYDLNEILESFKSQNSKDKKVIIYHRLNNECKDLDLKRELRSTMKYCNDKNYQETIFFDVKDGADINGERLISVVKLIESNSVDELILDNKDIFLVNEFNIIQAICESHNVKITIVN